MDKGQNRLDIENMRQKLATVSGKRYWRGIEELVETPEFKSWLDDEFPQRATIPDFDRRSFLKVMGASLALAGLAGCRSLPEERIVPYVKAPEERLPGQVLYYATAMPFDGYGMGLLVTSNEGRPTKIEGNPDHPSSLGSTDAFSQAELLQMYDPDRTSAPFQGIYPSTWEDFFEAARPLFAAQKASKGQGIRLLTGAVTSPTLYGQIQEFLKVYPGAQWYQYQMVNRDHERLGSQMAFGQIVDTHYDLSKAEVVLSLDGDLLGCTPKNVRHIRDFMANRNPEAPMNRLYAVESTLTTTGAFADHRLAVKPSEIEGIAREIASRVRANAASGALPANVKPAWVDAVVADLTAHKGTSLVVTSERQPAVVHALIQAINNALGNAGSTVTYSEPVEPKPAVHLDDLSKLTADLNAGTVDVLLILGGNPAFDAPPDIKFRDSLAKFSATQGKVAIHHGMYDNETAALCAWHLPESHFLESWGDVRSYDGTTSIIQPLIAPLFDSKSTSEFLSDLLGKPIGSYDLVRATWLKTMKEQEWRDALNRGTLPNSQAVPKTVSVQAGAFSEASAKPAGGEIEAVFGPDPTIHDGRYNNNGWMQETPKPITKLSWDNAVIMGPRLATQLEVEYQENVEVSNAGGTATAPVYVLPGMPDNTVELHLGFGRTATGKVGTGTGTDFNIFRNSASPWIGAVSLKKAGFKSDLAMSQTHHSMDGRDIVREGSYDEYQADQSLAPADFFEDKNSILFNLTEEWMANSKQPQEGFPAEDLPQWGMTIDLNTCIGCNACAIACQAENNIPTVGKVQVQRGHIMMWIRIDRYFRVEDNGHERDFHEPIAEYEAISADMDKGSDGNGGAMDPNNVRVVCMPVPCMHCETAPCEVVCPVAATVHSHEGLNQMVYNRCVGTRYCSNNCPYKVRRFNFFNYQFRQPQFQSDRDITLLNLMNNPDVTVRSRGVMEKCSYCVQRINRARITAKKEIRPIKDGEVVPACAQACPSKAIVFGNIADPTAQVTKQKAKKRNYSLLDDLNTRPRTTYLVKVRNINKSIPV